MASASKKKRLVVCALLLIAGVAGTLGSLASRSGHSVSANDVARGEDAGVDRAAQPGRTARTERRRVEQALPLDGDEGDADSGTPAERTAGAGDTTAVPADGARAQPPAAPPIPGDAIHVTALDGTPIAGARVEIRRAPVVGWPSDYAAVLSAMLDDAELVAQGITDADGGVRVPALADGGTTLVRVAKSGHGTATLRRFGASEGVAVSLGKGHDIRGTVRFGDGESETGLIVMLTRGEGPPVVHDRTETNVEGRFAFTGVPSGKYGVWVAWPGGQPSPAQSLDIQNDVEPVLRVRAGGTISGTVRRAATGDPVGGVRVLALGSGAFLGMATTGPDGTYRLRLLGDDTVKRLTAWKNGMAEVALGGGTFTVGAGVVRVADLDIFAGGTLVGVVRGPDGPVAGASVQVWTADGRYITNTSTETAADGTYSVEGLRPGLAHVLVSRAGGLVHPGQPGDMDRWRALLEGDLDPRCAVTIADGGTARLDVTMEPMQKKATAAR